MVSFEEARTTILAHVQPLGAERVHVLEAVGRVLAEDMTAAWDMPLWDNAAMDGYAVRSEDCTNIPCRLRVTGFLPAGAKADGLSVEPGCAIRIMTGAPVPFGCDAIVPVEDTDNGAREVTLLQPVKKRRHFRFQGEDVVAGMTFARSGTIIRAPEINLLATFGMALAPVYRRPVVAIVSTGDELVELGKAPAPGEIINSNMLSLAAAVKEAGGISRIIGIARDNPECHRKLLTEGLKADVLITSAGVSAGDHDFVRDVLEELGTRQVFWKVAMKPGGPTTFAMYGSIPVFCLPGNPVSTLITFEEFARPALLRMQGYRMVQRPLFKVVLRDEMRKKAGKVQIVRVCLKREEGQWYASFAGKREGALAQAMADTTAFAVLPAEATFFAVGDEVEVHFHGNHIDLV